MSADVAGYSALMAADEEGTLSRLTVRREEVIEPAIAEYGGRVVKLMGDGLLAEFPSVVAAVRASVEIQRSLAERNLDIPAEKQIVFRIGINQGDVIIDGDDIYGDDVNIAARLQERAAPGGICISERVYGDVRGNIDVAIDDLGDQELKNIPEPVRVYRVLMGPEEVAGGWLPSGRMMGRRRIAKVLVSLIVLLAAGASAWYWQWAPKTAKIGLVEQAKPSIAVLPFSNLSKDPEQEYFSDGITGNIITDLSKFNDLLVIASNSVRGYKGRNISVEDVARKLGVRYVLEGSIQKAGDRVRINTQLVDGTSGRHLWAERYDESIADIFDLQDRITRNIVGTLAVRLTDAERQRTFSKPTSDLRAYDLVMRGKQLLSRQERKANFEARELFRKAIERDESYADAYTGLANTYFDTVLYGWTGTPEANLERTHDLVRHAIALDNNSAYGYALLGRYHIQQRKFSLGLVALERAIALNPNNADIHAQQGKMLVWAGYPDGAILSLETAQRFDPVTDPERSTHLALAFYLKDRFSDVIETLEPVLAQNPSYEFGQLVLVATLGQMGRRYDAEGAARNFLQLSPFFTTENFTRHSQFRNKADALRLAEGLRKAGLD